MHMRGGAGGGTVSIAIKRPCQKPSFIAAASFSQITEHTENSNSYVFKRQVSESSYIF